MPFDINDVRKFVGNITFDQMTDVDTFLSDNTALFIPSTGPCKYSISENHSHPSYSFVLSFDNYCRVIVEDKKELISSPGIISGFSPGILHHEKLTEEFTRYIAIMTDSFFFENQFKEYTKDKPPLLKGDFFKSTNDLRNYLKDFMIEYKNKLPGYKNILNAIGLNIVHSIIRIILNCETSKEEIGSRIDINNIIEYMHLNYNKKLSVEQLSNNISLSSSHFSRIFKKETGKSPLDYLIHIRLEKAKKLILSSNKSLTEIAYDTGFNSSSHFTSSFSKKFKITPSEYKKAI